MRLGRYAFESPIGEISLNGLAGIDQRGDFDFHLGAQAQAMAHGQLLEIETFGGDVLADRARKHVVALGHQPRDLLHRIQTHRAIGPAVPFQIGVLVAFEAERPDDRFLDGAFGHAAGRNRKLDDFHFTASMASGSVKAPSYSARPITQAGTCSTASARKSARSEMPPDAMTGTGARARASAAVAAMFGPPSSPSRVMSV